MANIELDGANKTLKVDSGDLTLDIPGDIVLDADGGDVFVKDAGTTFGSLTNTSGNLIIKSGTTTAATFSGANATLAGTVASGAITSSGIIKTDDATEATSTTDGSLQTDGGLSVVKDAVFGDDIKLLSDASVIHFGANSEVTLTHSHDSGILLKHTATADDKPINLVLQTGETDMAQDDVIGKISFQAPDEGTGTDAILVSAAIQARAEGDHSSSSNATSIDFLTGASEAAAKKLSITSAGHFIPSADNTNDIGTASLEFKDGYFDGTLHCDVLDLAGTEYTSISSLAGIDDQTSSNDDQVTIHDDYVVINEDSDDVDFRVESNSNTHMLFVDAGNNRVTVGLSAAAGNGELNVQSSGSRTMTNSFYNETHANILDNTCLEIMNSDTTDNNFSSILFIDSGGFANGGIHCVNIDHDTSGGGELVFTTRNDNQNSDTITNCGRFNNIGDFMVGSSNNSPSDTKGSYMDYSGELVAHVDTSNAGPTLFEGYSSHGGTQQEKFKVTADGSVQSRSNSYGAFSDERLKKDIVDASSQWDDVKAFKFKNFKLKSIDGTDNEKQLGVLAQDLESVSPKLIIEVDPTVPDILISSEFGEVENDLDRPKIYDNPENLPSGKKLGDLMLDGSGNQLYKKKIKSTTGKKVKQVKYSVLYMKAIKALQEAQTRIETLETKVAALEG
jgi:hypothetical protein